MKVTLRKRKKKNSVSLYLDYYSKGIRQYEYLNLYLIPKPERGKLTKQQKEENKKNLALAESIRSKRHLQIQNGSYGFQDRDRARSSFIKYFEYLTEKRNSSKGNYGNWLSTLKHLKKFIDQDITFEQLNREWLEDFKSYLSEAGLSQNSQCAYYSKVRAGLRQAVKDGIIIKNPANEVESVKPAESERQFLTIDELQAMVKAKCDSLILKNAFLFSALTGLRWSDISKLTWSEVQYSKEMGHYVRYHQKKTKVAETLPIPGEAVLLLGDRGKPEQLIFAELKYSSSVSSKLQEWATRAGITKHISFHCSRHSYATLQLTLGTDLYTVSKLLGHKHIKTTQVYARIIDQKKTEAANKIRLDLSHGS